MGEKQNKGKMKRWKTANVKIKNMTVKIKEQGSHFLELQSCKFERGCKKGQGKIVIAQFYKIERQRYKYQQKLRKQKGTNVNI